MINLLIKIMSPLESKLLKKLKINVKIIDNIIMNESNLQLVH
jgi:hypothetical protein